jgi:predicted membrane protein
MMIARLFSAFVEPSQVPFMVNFLSALSSGATIMFLFWSITHLAKKMAGAQAETDKGKMWAVLGSGMIGGLIYTFSDTFWFSAVVHGFGFLGHSQMGVHGNQGRQ